LDPQPIAEPRRRRSEWPDSLTEADLVSMGWRPVAIRQFLFKVFTRCNLNCDYCYVYELADQSWRDKPNLMSREVVVAAAMRIGEHARSHDLSEVRVIFHGGEPLLAGAAFLEFAVMTVSEALDDGVVVRFGIQTNGVLLDNEMIETCSRLGIGIGVSLDGNRQANDRHRLLKNGTSSYDKVLAGIQGLKSSPHRRLFTGALCTIDLANDPIETYEALVALGAPGIDFLLPHGNWTTPPPNRPDDVSTPYADWLITIFDRWFDQARKEVGIRFFEEIINLILGGRSQVETIGLTPATLAVIETNGDIEQVDALKSAFDGAAATGLSVFDTSFDDALRQPGMAARQIGAEALCESCRSCPVGSICGGGYYPHRYREGEGFLNPSVYCADLLALIAHISDRVVAGLKLVGSR